MRRVREIWDTLRMIFTLVCARHFGRYVVSHHRGMSDYHEYEWRGQRWGFPIGPLDEDD